MNNTTTHFQVFGRLGPAPTRKCRNPVHSEAAHDDDAALAGGSHDGFQDCCSNGLESCRAWIAQLGQGEKMMSRYFGPAMQTAFVVRNIDKHIRRCIEVGIGPFFVSRNLTLRMRYREERHEAPVTVANRLFRVDDV